MGAKTVKPPWVGSRGILHNYLTLQRLEVSVHHVFPVSILYLVLAALFVKVSKWSSVFINYLGRAPGSQQGKDLL